jgi:hypothetical protein
MALKDFVLSFYLKRKLKINIEKSVQRLLHSILLYECTIIITIFGVFQHVLYLLNRIKNIYMLQLTLKFAMFIQTPMQ